MMRKYASLFLFAAFLSTVTLNAEESSTNPETFAFFTGKVLKNKVRMRLQPNLESAVIRELSPDELLVVTGEDEEFYAVKPPSDIKAYIYRTFVLDGIVEGTHVNVRLEPDTDSIILTQLNSGDKVGGDISGPHSKWLEITPPDNVQFYVAKDYIEKIGDVDMLASLHKRKTEVEQLLGSTLSMGTIEIEKPYEEIVIDDVNHNLDAIINDYHEFPNQVQRATAFKQKINDEYIQKKIAYLEEKAQGFPQQGQAGILTELQTMRAEFKTGGANASQGTEQWIEAEQMVFTHWTDGTKSKTLSDFYEAQKSEAVTLRGIIEPYQRPVRNKPGDYVLLNRVSRLPVAFLYSTVINLQNYEDQEVTIQAAERPNNNFAFPAYFVLSVE